jgi:hypothetical protein
MASHTKSELREAAATLARVLPPVRKPTAAADRSAPRVFDAVRDAA